MKILITTDKTTQIITSLEDGLKELGHEIDVMKVEGSVVLSEETLKDLKARDFVHDTTGIFFNFLRDNGSQNTLYHAFSYFPRTSYKNPIVTLSRRQADLIEQVSLGMDPEPAPSYYYNNRYMHFVSPLYVYPDIKVPEKAEKTIGEKTAFLAGMAEKELYPEWEKHLEPLLQKYDIICLQQIPELFKKYHTVLANTPDELSKLLKEQYNTLIYWTTTHIPFPIPLFYPLLLKCKVIATSYGGIPELITHGQNGYIANNREAIEYAIQKPMPKNIRLPAQCIYPAMAKNFVDIYNRIIAKEIKMIDYSLAYVF